MAEPTTDLARELRETITWIEERAMVVEQVAARLTRGQAPGKMVTQAAAMLRIEVARMRGRAKLLRLATVPLPTAAGVPS